MIPNRVSFEREVMLTKPGPLRHTRKRKRKGYGVARPWEPGYTPPAPFPKKRVLPVTPLKWRDTDGKVYFRKVAGYSSGQLDRMRKKELRDKPFGCRFANCTIRFKSKVKRYRHEQSRHPRTLIEMLTPVKCDRCGIETTDLKRHLDDPIHPCRESITMLAHRKTITSL
mmetsp:Transcript_1471/g.2098  ORF Transcript_1471/g.2098 Transcript_1471/m.2098 type:complete len:169 (+) Transcript_1471:100-606(+)